MVELRPDASRVLEPVTPEAVIELPPAVDDSVFIPTLATIVLPVVATAMLLEPACVVTAPAFAFVLPIVVTKPAELAVLMFTAVLVAVTFPPFVTFKVAALFDKPTLAFAPDKFVEVEPVIVLVAPVTVLLEEPALPMVLLERTPLPNVLVVSASVAIVALPVLESVPVIEVLPVT